MPTPRRRQAPRAARRADRRSSRGAVAVEMAIVLPLLLLVIGGIVDFGRAMYTEITLTNSAREGARAAIGGGDAAEAETRARAAAPGGIYDAMAVTTTACGDAGTDASVTTSLGFDWILVEPAMSLFGAGGAFPDTLTATAVMRCV